MRAVVIFESLTGNTAKAGRAVAAELGAAGIATQAFPIKEIDYQALADAELVIVGSWVDGLVLVGQRPGRLGRIKGMPALAGKQAFVYLTYAIDAGQVAAEALRRGDGPRRRGAGRPAHPAGQARDRRGRVLRRRAAGTPGFLTAEHRHAVLSVHRSRRPHDSQGPTPLTRSTAIRTTVPGGGSSIGGKVTSGPM